MNIDTNLNLGPRYSPTTEPDEITCYCGEVFYADSDEWEKHVRECKERSKYEC